MTDVVSHPTISQRALFLVAVVALLACPFVAWLALPLAMIVVVGAVLPGVGGRLQARTRWLLLAMGLVAVAVPLVEFWALARDDVPAQIVGLRTPIAR